MIAVHNIIFFFDGDGNIINFVYLSNELKDLNYTLIPYKLENNFLYYIIVYPKKNYLIINEFKFNIDYPNTNQIISSKSIDLYIPENSNKKINKNNNDILITNITKINCIFKNEASIKKEFLVCFYAISFPKIIIQAKFLDIKNDFNEIAKYSRNLEIIDEKFVFPNFFSVRKDKKSKTALIYLINRYPYMINFNLDKLFFGEITKIIDLNSFKIGYSNHKMLRIKNDNETLIISSIKYNFCKLYILSLDPDLNIINKAVIDHDFQCENFNSFFSFTNGKIYTILNINNSFYLKNLNKKSRKLDSTEEKCATATEASKIFNLCITCNTGYYAIETPTNITYDPSFKECYKENENPKSFYLDKNVDPWIFKPCYETCAACEEKGDEYDNHCTECAIHYKPNRSVPSDCVVSCSYFYYYTFYGQYKCSEGSNCPEEAPLYIFKLKKCTDDCKTEDDYKYLYAGECFKDGCPEDTQPKGDSGDDIYICIDTEGSGSSSKCKLSKQK